MTKPRKRGMGINALFDQTADDQAVAPRHTSARQEAQHPPAQTTRESDSPALPEPAPRPKIRNTFVIYEDTMRTLEMLRVLAERKKAGNKDAKVTYGDLIDEAVQALLEKKSQDEDLEQKLKDTLKMSR